MKKIGQKLSFLTKIMLVIGLLISNLSSLSVVFAYETEDDVVINLKEDILEIEYNQELADEVEAVEVRVYENYTYSDGFSEEKNSEPYSLTAEQLLAAKEGNLELSYNSMFFNENEDIRNIELFDGLYKVRVEVVDVTDYPEVVLEEILGEEITEEEEKIETEVIVMEEETTDVNQNIEEQILLTQEENEIMLAVATYEKEIIHESGVDIKLFDSEGTEITIIDGKFPVSAESANVTIVTQILSGGLASSDVFEYNGESLSAVDLLTKEFKLTKDFSGYLFGEYEIPVEVKLNKLSVDELGAPLTEELVYLESVNILYESYEMNAYELNRIANSLGYGEAYMFYSDSKDGILYVLSEIGEVVAINGETVVTRTMLDLYNMLNSALGEEEQNIITYKLLKNGINILESYVPVNEEDTLENYLSEILLDDTVQIVFSNEGLTITYDVVLVADLNNDMVVTNDDVLELIDQVVGNAEVTNVAKSDIYALDGKVNAFDALYLNQVVRSENWDIEFLDEHVNLNASLIPKFNGELLSDDNKITSGDEFTVDYVLSISDYAVNGVSGLFNYDKSLFELISLEVIDGWQGNNSDKFLYLGNESLTGPEFEDTETQLPEGETDIFLDELTIEDETDFEEDTVVTEDYVVVSAKFKALKSTEEENSNVIGLKEIELFNSTNDSVTYYVLDKTEIITDTIDVVASDDNTLSYLEVAGQTITLEDGVYEYQITVENDIKVADLKYILGNVAANITSIVCPEELVEGENIIILTVTSETGISQDYTIIVVREEAPEETVTYVNYSNNYDDPNNRNEEVVVNPGEIEEEEEVEEESNLSRIIIIILILFVIAGLVYLIFRDEDDAETKKTNKEINKLKKEVKKPEVGVPEVKTTVSKKVDKPNNKNNVNNKSNSKNSNSGNNKKNNSKSNNIKNNKKER